MVATVIYVEGGGDSKELHSRCREAFRRLLERCGFSGRMPRTVACGSRGQCFSDFTTAHASGRHRFVALWIDSEEPVQDIKMTWDHLKRRDGWDRPRNADDEQVLFMTTCMETWMVADRAVLRNHYGHALQESALPSLVNLEDRPREGIQDALYHATRNCGNAYCKGRRSFALFGELNPALLQEHLPSFCRVLRILTSRL